MKSKIKTGNKVLVTKLILTSCNPLIWTSGNIIAAVVQEIIDKETALLLYTSTVDNKPINRTYPIKDIVLLDVE